ncbi:msl4039 [Mesorhizobium japonicum MAFF 303099]|uniref:Msl4039 protein n=1 Tax=Mesorhizobium japonicum (strain LMG 29417 / CECT 9101 / MAFF 303099) TaxID=266835 RepID=Q98EX5_RHILO|nr:msl4039 [Mesorhizobium japonicum MAFF 303099]
MSRSTLLMAQPRRHPPLREMVTSPICKRAGGGLSRAARGVLFQGDRTADPRPFRR